MSLNDSKKKKVQVITSRGHVLATYESAREAARRTNIHHSQINHVCAKKESHAKGFVFRHADPQAELNQLSLQELQEAKQSALDLGVDTSVEAGKGGSRQKKVQVVTSQGNVLATYKSAAEAARRTGISRGDISNICLGNRTNAKGFVFRYADPGAELNQLSLAALQESKQSANDLGEEVQHSKASKKRGRSSRLDASGSEEEAEEKEEDSSIICTSCEEGGHEDQLITCSSCLSYYHTFCLEPTSSKVPTTKEGGGAWQCAVCATTKRKRRRTRD